MFIVFFFIFGVIFGSFINCLVYRLHIKESILGRSFCPNCKHKLNVLDLFPILSFLFLKGKCRYCKDKIASQYFIVELISGLVFSCAYLFLPNYLLIAFYFLISIFLIIIFLYDLKYYLVVDQIIYPAIIISLVYRIIFNFNLWGIFISLLIGFLFFWIQYFVSKGRWIGGGDILIGLMIGALFSWSKTLLCIFIAYILGSIFAIFLLLSKKKDMSEALPFGPFLTFSAWLVFLFGDVILSWYLSIIL